MSFVCQNDSSHTKTEPIPKKDGGIFIIIAAVSATVIVVCGIAFLLIRGGKRRTSETADEVTAALESDISSSEVTESEPEESADDAEILQK